MAQHDYVLSNASGLAFRADVNLALAAIASQNSGANAPSTTYAYQWWPDTTAGQLKIRNAANNAWIVVGSLADIGLGLLSRAGGTMTGPLLVAAGTAAAPGMAVTGNPNTGLYSKALNELGVAIAGALTSWFDGNGLNLAAQDDVRFWDADSSHYVGLQAPATVTTNRVWTLPATDGTTGQGLTTNGSGVLSWATLLAEGAAITAATSVASTSGISIDFTGIPNWVKRVTVMFNGVSTNGTSGVEVRLGTSGGLQASGYNCVASSISGTNTTNTASSATGAIVVGSSAAASRVGSIVFNLLGSNAWSFSGVTSDLGVSATAHAAGLVSLSGALDRLRLTTVNGTDTFDGGSVNILYEG
jgi:hypothetical protein